MKRYDSYKNSGVEWIGDIPSEWECIRLGMLGDFSSSGIDKKSKENETPVRMVNYTDLIQSRKYYPIQTGDKEYMRVTTPQSKLEEHRLKKGDMVFIPSSETHEDLGYSSLIDFDENDIVYSYHILRYITKKPVYHYYKKYLINHHSVLNQFSSECKGTTRQIIGRDVFNNVRVVLPPLSEQQQIVTFLDTKTSLIDSLIEKTQRKIELLKEKRISLINEVVTKGLNPNVEMKDSGVEWIGEIPSSWDTPFFGLISNLQQGLQIPFDNRFFEKEEGMFEYITTKSVHNPNNPRQYVLNPKKSVVCGKDEILYGRTGNTGEVITNVEGVFHNNFFKIDYDKNKLVKEYLIYQLTNSRFRETILLLSGTTTIPDLNHGDFNSMRCLIPPVKEQQQIVEYLDEQTQLIDNTTSIEEKRIELLKEYRQSLISEVVTGKRKVI